MGKLNFYMNINYVKNEKILKKIKQDVSMFTMKLSADNFRDLFKTRYLLINYQDTSSDF